MKNNCGSSWNGFWKIKDRYEAWLKVADAAAKTADGYAMANRNNGFPIECETVKHMNRLFLFAYKRAKKIRPEWVKMYR